MSPLNAVIYTTISYTLWVEWYYLKNNYLNLRSKSHEGHYSTRHTTLWSCTHIPNIIYLSRKTKMLWPRQASLRRSGRKNQTKTICLPSFEGWSGQASLRRSGRKNQTKTICVPSFEGWSGQASLRRSGRKNQTKTICVPSFEGETYLIYL